MASASSSISSSLPVLPPLYLSRCRERPFSSNKRFNAFALVPRKPSSPTTVFAVRREAHDQNYSGRLVDENLIVLRKRIHEMKVVERNYEPPAEWMEWEKRYYANYDSIICEAMGFLQSQLMNTRPTLALGLMALITLSVPVSTAVVLSHLIDLTTGVLSHLG